MESGVEDDFPVKGTLWWLPWQRGEEGSSKLGVFLLAKVRFSMLQCFFGFPVKTKQTKGESLECSFWFPFEATNKESCIGVLFCFPVRPQNKDHLQCSLWFPVNTTKKQQEHRFGVLFGFQVRPQNKEHRFSVLFGFPLKSQNNTRKIALVFFLVSLKDHKKGISLQCSFWFPVKATHRQSLFGFPLRPQETGRSLLPFKTTKKGNPLRFSLWCPFKATKERVRLRSHPGTPTPPKPQLDPNSPAGIIINLSFPADSPPNHQQHLSST